MSQCGKYLILYAIRERVYSHIYFADLEKIGKITGKLSLTQVVTESRAVYEVSQIFQVSIDRLKHLR